MKKILTIVLIVVLVLVSFCAITFASPNITKTTDSEPLLSQVTPQFNYIPLVAPKIVSSNLNYIVSASDSQLFVYNSNGKYSVFPLNLPNDTTVIQLAITSQIAVILYEFIDTSTAYIILSLTDGQTYDTHGVNLPSDVLNIDEDGDNIYMWKGDNTLDKLSIVDNALIVSQVAIPQESIFRRSKLFDIYNNEIYVYNSSSAIVKLTNSGAENIVQKGSIISFKMSSSGVYSLTNVGMEYYDIPTAEEWKKLDGEYKALSVTGNTAYSCLTVQNKIIMASSVGGEIILKPEYLGDKGNAVDRLDTPNDLAIHGDNLFVADSGNRRISYTNLKTTARVTYSLGEVAPKLITAYQDTLTVIDSNNILRAYCRDKSSDLTQIFSRDLSAQGEIIDIENHLGVVIALTKGGDILIIVEGQDTIKYLTSPGAKAISINEHSQYMYIMSKDITTRYNLKTNQTDKDYSIDSQNHTDISIDFVGTGYFVNGNMLDRYSRANQVYSKDNSYDMAMAQTKIKLHLNSGDMYILDRLGHKLMRIDSQSIGSKSLNDMGYTHPTEDNYDVSRVYKMKDKTTLYSAPNNDEAVTMTEQNELFFVLAKVVYNDIEYSYGVRYGEQINKYYIESTMLEQVSRIDYPSNHPPMMPIFPSGAKVYKYPYKSANVLSTASKSSEILLINNVAEIDNKQVWQWYEVQYKSDSGDLIRGYVESNDIYYSSVVAPPKNRDYLKVQAENFSGSVKMYKEPNEASEVLYDNLSDGTKVILGSEQFDLSSEYTKVIYDNKVGYIKTVNLIPEGLTQSEITSIVVVSVSILVIILLIALLLLRKKIFKKKTREVDVIPRQ